MGNLNVVLNDLKHADSDEDEKFDKPRSERPPDPDAADEDKSLASIRTTNLNKKTDRDKTQHAPNTNTIVEEAVLEDLCEEASLELEETKNGPMSEDQKALLLTQLSTNDKTKHHFKNPDQFEEFVNEKIHGDIQTAHILDIAPNYLQRTSSNGQLGARQSRLSHRSIVSRRSNMGRSSALELERVSSVVHPSRMSNFDLTERIRQQRTSTMSTMSNRGRGGNARASWNRAASKLSASRISASKICPEETSAQPRQSVDQLASNQPRKSTATTYSLPADFANSPMNTTDKKKTAIVCKTNEKTLQMATQMIDSGKAKLREEESDSDSDDGIECFCFTCARNT